MAQSQKVLAYALAYARKGWHVVPLHNPTIHGCSCGKSDCKSVGKHPRTLHGLKDGSTDESVIRGWWKKWPEANVGICTGTISNLCALDVDDGGNATLVDLEDSYGELPETVGVITGSGGSHFWFSIPGETVVHNTSKKIGSGLDFRGEGGYVVAPPSLHGSGNEYGFRDGYSPKEIGLSVVPAWLVELNESRDKPAEKVYFNNDVGQNWLGKALAKANEGNRNDTGFWLACQLRDSGIRESAAEQVMRSYAQRCPGASSYSEREALASLRSAYSESPRQPAGTDKARHSPKIIQPEAPTDGASKELRSLLDGIIDGRIYDVPLPWHYLTILTQALLPGSVCAVCGDPGVGKTFFVLQCLQHWVRNGYSPAVLFVEKDRKFHLHRLLAQLEGRGDFVDFGWVRRHGEEVKNAIASHGEMLDMLGKHISTHPIERMNMKHLLAWFKTSCEAGCRVIVIDPITMIDAGEQRYLADDAFMYEAQRLAMQHGASILIVTHPKKGAKSQSGHDMGGGAAFHRFTDTVIWLHKPERPKRVKIQGTHGSGVLTCGMFFQLHKTRNGRGAGTQLAYTFERNLKFVEQGLVKKVLKEGEPDED